MWSLLNGYGLIVNVEFILGKLKLDVEVFLLIINSTASKPRSVLRQLQKVNTY